MLDGLAKTLTLAIGLSLASPMARATDVSQILTEVYPPYNMLDFAGEPVGIAVDLLNEMFLLTDGLPPVDIEVTPWSRAYREVRETPGTILFSMTRTPEREDLFKWVGPIARTSVALITKVGTESSDLKALSIGVVRDDVAHQTLNALDIGDYALSFERNISSMIRKLSNGRLDAIAYESNVTRYAMRRSGIPANDFYDARILLSGDVYYAFHKSFDDEYLKRLQLALDQLREAGRTELITSRYLR